jgi:hypothetical protein
MPLVVALISEHQINLGLDIGFSSEPAVIPELREEIAQVWSLPLGHRVEVCFTCSQRAAITGTLELLTSPDYPWDPHQPLRLRIAGLVFSNREIECWAIV